MNIIDIKRDFIKLMEEKHTDLLFPKNYFGCMMAVFIEQKPITQDKIQNLTNYSKTTISQILKLLQLNFPLILIKKPKIRKKYYSINIPTKEFMITFLRMLIDAYTDKAEFILPLIEEIQPYTKKHRKFENFNEFLKNSYKYASLYISLLTETAEEFSNFIKTDKININDLINTDLLNSPENQKYLQSLSNFSKVSKTDSIQHIEDKQLAKIYIELKNKFYKKFRENLTSAQSQTAIARTILGTELLLENRPLTQEELEHATGFQRSIISETLKSLLNRKMIQIIKKSSDRKKYYLIVQSWDTRTINRLRINIGYAIEMKTGISELIKMTQQIRKDEDKIILVNFFQDIHHSYVQFEQYFKFLELRYLTIRLKEHLEKNN